MYHLLLCDEFCLGRALRIGSGARSRAGRPAAGRASDGSSARIIARNAPLGIQVTKEAGRKYHRGRREGRHRRLIPAIGERVMGSADAAEGIKSSNT